MFDGVTDFLNSDTVKAAGNAIPFLSPVMEFFGAQERNKEAKEQAWLQMQFQEYMSNTSYQRAVKDLEKAGLNPMLAYMRGGATTPAGAQAPIESETKGAASSALAAYQAQNLKVQNDLLRAQIHKTSAETAESVSRTNVNEVDARLREQNIAHSVASADELRSRVGVQSQQVSLMMAQADRIFEQNALTREETKLARERILNAVEERKLTIEKTGNTRVDTVLKQLEVPLARNLARAEESGWKENYSPFLRDVERIMRILRGGDTIINRR